MKKLVLSAFVLVLLSTAVVVRFVVPTVGHAKDGDGKFVSGSSKAIWVPDNFTSIQEAINNAYGGETIFVNAGTYYENVVVNKSLSLVGENRETTIIDGNKSGIVVDVKANNVLITNFTIRNGGDYAILGGGIRVEGKSHCNVKNNVITNNTAGIRLWFSSDTTISGNNITKNQGIGIWLLDSPNSTISGNNVSNNLSGVNIAFSANLIMFGNVMNDNRYSLAIDGNPTYSIDVSNLVNGSPVYYLVSQKDLVINSSTHPAVGYMALVNCSNIHVEDLTLANNGQGLLLFHTNNSEVTNNTITSNINGIGLSSSSNNTLSGNNITNSWVGISLDRSSDNGIYRNTFINSGLFVQLPSYGNMVENNTVNGKPLVYLEGLTNHTIKNAGQVILVNCNLMTVENSDLSNTTVGVQLLETSSTRIAGNNITNNQYGVYLSDDINTTISGNNIADNDGTGIWLLDSPNSTISGNNVSNNTGGVSLLDSPNSTISGNNITNNGYGVSLSWGSENSVVSGNNITNNGKADGYGGDGIYLDADNVVVERNTIIDNYRGIFLFDTGNVLKENTISGNVEGINIVGGPFGRSQIYHNNFIENEIQVVPHETEYPRRSIWDNGYPSGGNYWSDYEGLDANGDGVGDTSYPIDLFNDDRYPLMGPLSFFKAGTWNETTYYVNVVSNSTVSQFNFSEKDKMIEFNVTGPNYIAGFSRIAIPSLLLWCDSPEQWQVLVNSTPIEDKHVIGETDYAYIYFTYTQSMQNVKVIGTHVIPEIPTWTPRVGIYIRPDGSVDPANAPIATGDNFTYTLTGNVFESIIVERDNIVVDGAGYTVQGSGTKGIDLTLRSNVTIKNMEIRGLKYGIYLNDSSNINVDGNKITSNDWDGIQLTGSSHNTISGNIITKNYYGIDVSGYTADSSNNTISGNRITNNMESGISLGSSNDNNIIGNNITNNGFNDIRLGNSHRNSIVKNNITNSGVGVHLLASSWNTIVENNITNHRSWGVIFGQQSSYNSIARNRIAYTSGFVIGDVSLHNSIIANTIANNALGIYLAHDSSNNKFYHNNFVDNTDQVEFYEISPGSYNIWNNGYPSGGNYWSDYNGTDSDNDGIGDSPYVIDEDNQDNYPLMGMFSDFETTSEYHVQTICNSSISDFQFNGTAISFNVTGEDDTTGFCRILVPTALMNGAFRVFVNGTEIIPSPEPLPCSNSTHNYLYFTYNHSTQEVIIIPEFPTWTPMLLMLIVFTVALALYKRRLPKTPIH